MNVQNLPRQKGDVMRSIICAQKGFKIVKADYSQLELRGAAWYLRDTLWIRQFNTGEDLHTATAQIVFNDPKIDKNDIRRDFAKRLNFAILYGASVRRVAMLLVESMGVDPDQAKTQAEDILNKFYAAHPHIKQYSRTVMQRLDAQGYIENANKRKYIFPEFSRYKWLEYVVSGDMTGDMIKDKFAEVSEYYETSGAAAKLILTTHDELVSEVKYDEHFDNILSNKKKIMEKVDRLTHLIPITVDISYGDNYAEVTPWGTK